MFSLYKRWDDHLVKNKPHLWLTRLHVFLPVTTLLLFILFGIAFFLPLISNIYWCLVITSAISLLVLIYYLYRQRLFFNKALSEKQLKTIHQVHMVGTALLVAASLVIPCVLSLRVKNALAKDDFAKIETEIRVAMIKSDFIRLIKQGLLEQENPDSLLAMLQDYADTITELKENKFIHNSFAELDLYSTTVDSLADAFPVDTTQMSTDTAANVVRSLETADKKVQYKYSEFLMTLRHMPDSQIASIKKNVRKTLNYYGFAYYTGKDSSTAFYSDEDINAYFETLKSQTLNLNASEEFNRDFQIFLLFTICLVPTLVHFSLLVIMRVNFVIPLAALMLFYSFIYVIFTMYQYISSLAVYCTIVMILAMLYFSKLLAKSYKYSGFNLFCLYMSHYLCSAASITFMMLLMVLLSLISDYASAILESAILSLLLLAVSVFFVTHVINIPFIRRYIWISNLPKG